MFKVIGLLSILFLTIACSTVRARVSFIVAPEEDDHFEIKYRYRRSKESETIPSKLPKPDVYSYTIESDIKYRYAKTVISNRIANPAEVAQEVNFTVTLPESAYISEFLLFIKNQTYKAYIKEKEEAKKVYTEAKRAGKTAGHVELNARDSNVFTVSVNVEPLNKVAFHLTYEQVLERKLGYYENVININPGQVVESLNAIINVKESSALTLLEVSDLKTENEITDSITENKLVKISRPSDNVAHIQWYPSVEEQKTTSKDGLKGQLIVRYDVDRVKESSQILVQDGYFVHFFAPTDLPKIPKYLIFILDISASMSGIKLTQLKGAINQILSEVTPEDYFSIVTFSTDVQVWSPTKADEGSKDLNEVDLRHIVSASSSNVTAALKYVRNLNVQSATNIIGGLQKGVSLAEICKKWVSHNEPIIFFLTDGEPNINVSDPKVITKKITELNQRIRCPIFSLAMGVKADFDFLTSLSLSNYGFARKIYVSSDTHLQLKNFYKQIASPLLSNVTFHYVPEQVDHQSLTKSNFNNYFSGSELVIAGKLLEGYKADDNIDADLNYKKYYPWKIPKPSKIIIEKPNNPDSISGLERLWAYMYIKQLLENDSVSGTADPSNKKKALELSLKYSFVTPLTSLVVVKPNETESSAIRPADQFAGEPPSTVTSFGYARHGGPSYHKGGSQLVGGRTVAGLMPLMLEYDDDYSAQIIGGLSSWKSTTYRPPQSTITPSTVLPHDKVAKKLTIDDISWLNKTTIKLPNSSMDYIVESDNPNVTYQNCVPPNYSKGYCRYIKFCVIPEIVKNYEDYLPYSCVINNRFAGVCCPVKN